MKGYSMKNVFSIDQNTCYINLWASDYIQQEQIYFSKKSILYVHYYYNYYEIFDLC